MKNTTLVYLEKDHEYLMMLRNRKKEDPNEGKWIGIGGRIEEGETPEEGALREIKEETGIDVRSLCFRGIVFFINTVYETEYMYLYTSSDFDIPEGDPSYLSACDEGELHWVDIDRIDDLNLWNGDRIFLKLLKEDHKPFLLTLKYDKDELLSHSLRMVDI